MPISTTTTDLLAALSMIYRACQTTDLRDPLPHARIADIAREAITLATGGDSHGPEREVDGGPVDIVGY